MSTKKTVMARWQWSTISYPTLANTRKFQSVFLPDVAGDYTIDVLMATECKTSTPIAYWTKKTSVTFTATCPTAPTLVLKDGAGTAITTSKANPTSITLQNTHLGSEYTVLDASKSTKSDGYQIYYHWYWKSVEHGYDYDNSEWKDDHVGLGTPFSPILTLDPKLIPPSHNGRELMLTISDGCQNVTTAVKIFVQCTSENVNVLVDRSTLVLDPLYCINKVNIRTGVCINHYDIQVTVTPALVSGTAAALADQTFALNFKSVKEEDSGPNKTAIGLGIGLGLGIPILCLIGYCIYRSTRQRAPIKDSSSNHQQQHQQQHHQESAPAAAPAPVAEPAPAASPANTSPDDNNLAQNNGQPPSAVQDQKEAAAPPV
jgi:hypothetical protein